jgi:hypothetical protein
VKVAVLLGALAAWVLIPHPWEGPLWFGITESHGVHYFDVVAMAVVAMGLANALRNPSK